MVDDVTGVRWLYGEVHSAISTVRGFLLLHTTKSTLLRNALASALVKKSRQLMPRLVASLPVLHYAAHV